MFKPAFFLRFLAFKNIVAPAATNIGASSQIPKRNVAVEPMMVHNRGIANSRNVTRFLFQINSPNVNIVMGHGTPNVGVRG